MTDEQIDWEAKYRKAEEQRRGWQRQVEEMKAAQAKSSPFDALNDPEPDPTPPPPGGGESNPDIEALRLQVIAVERARATAAQRFPHAAPDVVNGSYQTAEELDATCSASSAERGALIEAGAEAARREAAAAFQAAHPPAPAETEMGGGPPRKPSMRDFLGLSFKQQQELPDSVVEDILRGDQ